MYPDYVDEGSEFLGNRSFNFPRPLSEPPSPSTSRKYFYHFYKENIFIFCKLKGHTTPAASVRGSDDEEDEVDDEQELLELGLKNH